MRVEGECLWVRVLKEKYGTQEGAVKVGGEVSIVLVEGYIYVT